MNGSITWLEEGYGKNIVEYVLHNKTGWDVSTKKGTQGKLHIY